MSSEILKELHENAEHTKHHPHTAPITLTMAVLAVVVATVSLLGHRTHTEEVVLENKISDGWAHYQAKSIRRNTDQMFVDLTSFIVSKDSKHATELSSKYQGEAKRYSNEQKDIEGETRKLEHESKLEHKRADCFDLGEVFLEIALVITSITLLTNQRIFWYTGMILGVSGVAVSAIGLLP